MDGCPHARIAAALDRWNECHWHIHQMEASYHEPEPFRYSLNSFVRAAKEVPSILKHDLQQNVATSKLLAPLVEQLLKNELFLVLKKRRDFIVHQGMLELKSRGSVGTVEGRRVKISFPFHVDPAESSDDAYERYKVLCRTDRLLRGLGPDCDSSPAVWRTWMLPQFPNRDLLDVAFEAWMLLGELLSTAVQALEGAPINLTMPCRHDPERVRIRVYSQREFFLEVDGIDLEDVEREYLAEKQRRQSAKR
jgi:hypothetical protein